ncbi:STM3941 family protein [Emticicia fluvialis]|uniref:STM3941 family protein n=1 Tax=Emticicia fluvialis TaxID=2974474 RepID=UPI00216530FA|nr:STM3941 family protein [Emticicia fluvialis]
MKTTGDRIEIHLNKQRLIFLLISALAFFAVGIWFVANPGFFKKGMVGNPAVISGIGMLTIVVFGLSSFVLGKKMIDQQPGVIIDKSGITDNSSGIAAGHIPWKDIKEIKPAKLFNKKFVNIVLKKPISKNNGAKKKGKKDDDIVVSISNNTLQCSFEELENSLKSAFEKYKVG